MKSSNSRMPSSLSILALSGLVSSSVIIPRAMGAEPMAPKTNTPTTAPKSSKPAENPPTPQDALSFLKLDKVRQICAQPIALKANYASADAVVAQVRRALTTAKIPSKIPIEVRRVKSINLTFASKNSTVAKVLSSTARLGAAQLWLFSDHLLLAPAESLTPAEQESVNNGFASSLGTNRMMQLNITAQKRAAYSMFISNEMNGLKPSVKTAESLTAREQRSSKSVMPLLANTTFDQLSPDSQAMMQELLSQLKNQFPEQAGNNGFGNLSFSANTTIEIIKGIDRNSLEVAFVGANNWEWALEWGIDGHTAGMRGGRPDQNQPTPPSKPNGAPPLDLSADKS